MQDSLARLGDLSGIVHDLNSDQIVGGNQRVRALDLLDRLPVITQRYDKPTRTGTVAEGYYEIDGERYSYRAVYWDKAQCDEANIVANIAGGDWDWDILSTWDTDSLMTWGFDTDALATWNDDAANLREMMNAEVTDIDYDEMWEGMPEFNNEDLSPVSSIKVNFANAEDRQKFAELIGQTITEKTPSIWYPKQKQNDDGREWYTESD